MKIHEIRQYATPLEQALLVVIPLTVAWYILAPLVPVPLLVFPGAGILLVGALVFAVARR